MYILPLEKLDIGYIKYFFKEKVWFHNMSYLIGHKLEKLNKAAEKMLDLIGQYIGVNTICITQFGDHKHSILTHVFNKKDSLFHVGDQLNLEDAY
jgi:hypothetical protein